MILSIGPGIAPCGQLHWQHGDEEEDEAEEEEEDEEDEDVDEVEWTGSKYGIPWLLFTLA